MFFYYPRVYHSTMFIATFWVVMLSTVVVGNITEITEYLTPTQTQTDVTERSPTSTSQKSAASTNLETTTPTLLGTSQSENNALTTASSTNIQSENVSLTQLDINQTENDDLITTTSTNIQNGNSTLLLIGCTSSPCPNKTLCKEIEDYVYCENPCDPNPCFNGGECMVSNDLDFACICVQGFTGTTCSSSITDTQATIPNITNDDDSTEEQGLSEMAIIVIAVSSVGITFCILWTSIFAWCALLEGRGWKKSNNNNKNPKAQNYEIKNGDPVPSVNGTELETYKKPSVKKRTTSLIIPDKISPTKIHALKAKWKIDENNLEFGHRIYSTKNFNIYDALLNKGKDEPIKVAIKKLKNENNKTAMFEHLTEFQILSGLGKHAHLMCMHGQCLRILDDSTEMCLVVEYVSNGNLLHMLRNKRWKSREIPPRIDVPGEEFMQIAVDVSSGMEYLSKKKVIHCELAARNILITFHNRAKISDFGLSIETPKYGDYMTTQKEIKRETRRWTAYEAILDHIYSTKSDVWSYGILLWEIATLGGIPYPDITLVELPNELRRHYRMDKPVHVSQAIYDTMLGCWHRRPESRPSFELLHREMKKLQRSGKVLIDFKKYRFNEYYSTRELADEEDSNV